MIIKIYTICIFILFPIQIRAHYNVYLACQDQNLYIANVAQCTSTLIGHMGVSLQDIALHNSNDTLYGVDVGGDLYWVDQNNGAAHFMTNLGHFFNAMTFDNQGHLYAMKASSDHLYIVNVQNGLVTDLGSTGTGAESLGDLIWTHDYLYLSSNGHHPNSPSILKINVDSLADSKVATHLSNTSFLNGLAGVTCNLQLFAFEGKNSFAFTLREYPFISQNCTNLVPSHVLGAASLNEFKQVHHNFYFDTTLCSGDTLFLEIIDTLYTVRWHDSDSSNTKFITTAGSYYVSLLNPERNCLIIDPFRLFFEDSISFDFGNDTILCDEKDLLLELPSNKKYIWQDSSSDSYYLVTEPGTYAVTVSGAPCFENLADTINIDFKTSPSLDDWPKYLRICEGDSVVLNASNEDALYQWQDGSTDSIYIITETGNYTVNVSTLCGNLIEEVYFDFNPCNCVKAIPNVFSPNGDGFNDFFKPIIECKVLEPQFQIFNRWGQVVFETEDLNKGWDGTHNGVISPREVYIYSLRYREGNGTFKSTKGKVTLLR